MPNPNPKIHDTTKSEAIQEFWKQHLADNSESAAAADIAKTMLSGMAEKKLGQRRAEDKGKPTVDFFAQILLGIGVERGFEVVKQEQQLNDSSSDSSHNFLSLQNFYRLQEIILDGNRASIKQSIEVLNFLNLLIDFGNSGDIWYLPLFDTLQKIPRPINPLGTEEEWQEYLYATEFKRLHLKFIRESLNAPQALSDETRLGMIITDLLFQSFVVNEKQLMMLIKQLPDEVHYQYQNHRLFFSVPVDDFNPNRRVFISPITELLIYRLTPNELIRSYSARTHAEKKVQHPGDEHQYLPSISSSRKTAHQIFASDLLKSVVAYIKQLGVPRYLLPTSLFGICRFAEKGLFDCLSPVLLGNASGALKSHSLKQAAFEKLYALSPVDALVSNQVKSKKPMQKSPLKNHGLKLVRKIFNRASRNVDPKVLQADILEDAHALSGLTPNLQYLLDWGVSQLKVLPGKNRFKVVPQKILSKLDSIARHILAVFNERDLLKLPADDRANIFLEVIDQAISDRNVNTIQYNLRGFNSWLEKEKKAPRISNKSEIFGDPKLTDMTVNSNLITFDEYEKVREHLKQLQSSDASAQQKDRYAMMDLMLILGFKCGLRSTEAFKLKVNDYIYCDEFPILIIRESYDRELKTSSAKRSFELANLLTADEMDVLNHRYRQVMQEIEKSGMTKQKKLKEKLYLFGKKSALDKTPPIQDIKTDLMGFLHEAAQDKSLNFHHLRHSFASWHFLSACIAELDLEQKDTFTPFPKTKAWLSAAKERKCSLIPTSHKSKKYPFWIAMKMGHANFRTTLEHYIHTTDIVSMLFQKKLAIGFNSEFWAALSGTNDSYLRKQKATMIDYACQHAAPEGLKRKKKTQQEQHQSFNFNADQVLTFPLALESLSADWHQKMQVYQTILALESLDKLSRKERSIEQYFKATPKYRLRGLNKSEKAEFDRLASLLGEINGNDLSSKSGLALEIKKMLTAFSQCLTPESKNLTTIEPQRRYQMLVTDLDDAILLTKLIENLKLQFKVIIHLKKPTSQSGEERNADDIDYWQKHLKLTQSQIDEQSGFQSHTGTHSRIEIRVLNDNNRRHHSFYYLMATLNVTHGY